ncbi:putative molybdopterin biosynthesis protein [Anaerobranca californiensis DSM 14826]|jgi:putative molybdopterin biosynthesis protein|uniref:Molybdopterin molybdenumtransferase n=1 Tax=Anaerobranca californiensis DSM 14826 TaxID=1120989 RepID=A0A1M6QB62_9FIRM|nr:molybdopterin biosynthesis protein [Anaerobranca californiensis]SHK17398.1 putative molybdopterin biosynthesis protein [Anaerobranca californiensis DSM 14826]
MMIYLNNTPLDEVLGGFLKELGDYRFNSIETISVIDGLDRVLAENIFAKRSVPHYHSSAMDGYQVRAEDTKTANIDNPIFLSMEKIKYCDTGEPIEPQFDSVIKIEDVHKRDNGIEIIGGATKWQNIRPIGEDITAHDLLFTTGRKLQPMDIAALIASGIYQIKVFKKPKVAIIPTGDEIIPWNKEPMIGEIPDSNSQLFANMVKKWGGEPTVYPITPDNFDLLEKVVKNAWEENDLILVNAGSSAGSEDYTSKVINHLGKVYYHGVAIKPGKPAIFGKIGKKPVIGVPGYPVSAFVVMEELVKKVFLYLKGEKVPERKKVEGKLTKPVNSDLKFQEYVRVKVGKIGKEYVITPLARGAALMSTVTQGDGFLIIPQNSEGYRAGEMVQVELFTEKDFDNTFVSIGSHDLALDILATHLAPKFNLSSAHVGSLGGIMAVKKGETHFAGIHLLDPQTGQYNISYVKKYLKGTGAVLIHLAKRTQGLMVAKGNPLNIKSIKDLKGRTIANRQKGAGTRVLLDYLMEKENIKPEEVEGYTREFFTHLAVAQEVKSGRADAAMGIYAATKGMDLHFVPLYQESYDLIVSPEFYYSPNFKSILEVLSSEKFRREVEELGGYNLDKSGEIIFVEGEKN